MARVQHGLVPPTTRPSVEELRVVGDFLKSSCVNLVFEENSDFQGDFCLLSRWADGGRVFPMQRGGVQKSLWVVMVCLFRSQRNQKSCLHRQE